MKFMTLNDTHKNTYNASPHSLLTMASSKTPVSVRKFSAHLFTDNSPPRKKNLLSSPAKIRSKTPLVKAELLMTPEKTAATALNFRKKSSISH
jgi:hypothetical protein